MSSEVAWDAVRADFPLLDQQVYGKPLVYLDNGATTQLPQAVLDAVVNHYCTQNANVHRAMHRLSSLSTNALEQARATVARFIDAPSSSSIVFTRGTTDSVNMVAASLARWWKGEFSAISTMMEHHSNFVPWQQAALETGGQFTVAPLTSCGDLDLVALDRLLCTQRPGILAVCHVSNVLGTLNPIAQLAEMAHAHGWLLLVDAAQGVRHEAINVQDLGCDFLCFSGHKIMGPTGIGVLYGREELLNQMPPVAFGGEMVDIVRVAQTTYEQAPLRFEAGTPNYVGAIGLAAALDYLESIGWNHIYKREEQLLDYLVAQLRSIPGVELLGEPSHRAGVVSVVVPGAHPFDLATLLDKMGVAARSGNQCAQPLLHESYDAGMVLRFTPAFYNTFQELDTAVSCLERALKICLG